MLENIVNIVWGPFLLVLLCGGGLFLLAKSKGLPLFYLKLAIKLISGKSNFGKDPRGLGQLSHFKALTNALSATVGIGNIAGVAVALTQGGPGAIFWMWISGIIGMNTKFFECTLSLLYRSKDYQGEIQGGPMFYIEKAFGPKLGKPMCYIFALAGLLGTVALFQINQIAEITLTEFQIPKAITGAIFSTFLFVILLGGLKRIAGVTSKLVPSMCILYISLCLLVLILNINKIPEAFVLILKEAFSLKSVGGGVLGYAFIHAFRIGLKRAAFSNEAGVGTAPMAHGNAKTSEPVAEGLVAMLGPLIDTMVVCTLTALTILVSVDLSQVDNLEGILLTARAFQGQLGQPGFYLLYLCVFLFGFSTMIGMANYNEKCWNYIFKGRRLFRRNTFISFFTISIFFGAIGSINFAVNIIDIGFGIMAYPNMIAVLILSPKVLQEIKKLPK